MKINMSATDSILRILAMVLAFFYFSHVIDGPWALALIIAAIIFLITALISFCPLYSIFGISTYKTKK